MKHQKREIKLIDKEFQVSFILKSLVLVILTAIVLIVSVLYFFNEMNQMGVSSGLQKNDPFFEFINLQKNKFLLTSFVSIAIISCFVFFWSLSISHRIAGPIYKIKQDAERKLNGETIKFSIREKDYFQELPKLLNQIFTKKE